MMRVLQVDPGLGEGVQIYRVEHLAEQIAMAGGEVVGATPDDLRAWWRGGELDAVVADTDLIVLHRYPHGPELEPLREAAARARVRVLFEIDDLIFVPGIHRWVDGLRHLDDERRALYVEGVERYAATYQACDGVLTSTPFLGGLRPYGPVPTRVVPNVLGRRQLAAAEALERGRPRDGVVLAYGAGTATHDGDLQTIAPALAEVLAAHADARLCFVGPVQLPEELRPLEDRIERRPLQPWQDWWSVLSTCDVALAPLDRRNPYCRAKSGLKYLEAGALGLPTVASRIDGYRDLVQDGPRDGVRARGPGTGRLAGDHDEWVAALTELIRDAELRRQLGAAAREDVLQHHTTDAAAAGTAASLAALASGDVDPAERPQGWRGFDLATVIPPAFQGSGGHTVIFRAVRALQQRGHPVTVFAEAGPDGPDDDDILAAHIDRAFFPTGARYRQGWDIDPARFDAAMATAWNTVRAVAPLDVPARLYFVQDLEHLFFPASEDAVAAERTYKAGLSCITIGRWLTEVMRHRYGTDSVDFPFLLHVERSRPDGVPVGEQPTVVFFAQPGKARRAFRTGIAALARVHAAHPEVRMIFFGSRDVDPATVPFPFEDRGIVTEAELEELYVEADIGFVISLTNPSAVPPNMMRCGCAVVDVDLENNRFEYRHGVDSLLADFDADAIAAAINSLVEDRDALERMKRAAMDAVADRCEERSMDLVEGALVRSVLSGCVELPERLDLFQGHGATPLSLAEGTVVQTFRSELDGLCAVSVPFGTYDGEAGDVQVLLRSLDDGREVARRVFRREELTDNAWHRMELDPVPDSAGREYAVEIAMADRGSSPAALYVAEPRELSRGHLRVGDRLRDGSIRLKVHAAPDGHRGAATSVDAAPAAARRTRAAATAPAEASLQAPTKAPTPTPPRRALSAEPPAAALRAAELLRARHTRQRQDWRALDRRMTAVETATRRLAGGLQRARNLLRRSWLRRPLTALRLLPRTESWLEDERFVTPELIAGSVAAQHFLADEEGLAGVGIRFATEGRRAVRSVRLRLHEGDRDGPVVRETVIPAERIRDNHYARVEWEPLTGSRGRPYVLELVPPEDVLPGSAARVWGRARPGGRRRQSRHQGRYQDGCRAPGRLDLQLRYDHPEDPTA